MTMHIYFNQNKDGYKKGESCYVEVSLARRFCENGIAMPYQTHLDNVYDEEQVIIEAEEKAQAEKAEAEEKKKAELLEKKKKAQAEKAEAEKPGKSENAVKK